MTVLSTLGYILCLFNLGINPNKMGVGWMGNSLYFVWYRRGAAGIAPIFDVIYTSTGHDFFSHIYLMLSSIQSPAVLRLTTWPLSLHDIFLFSDKNSVYNPICDCIGDFLHETTPSKWKQGTLLFISHDGLYIYGYTFSIFQYTFIGWGGPAAHMYQVHAQDPNPPPPIQAFFRLGSSLYSAVK